MVEMVESNLNTVPETDPGYGQLFAILIRRRLWLLGILCLALGIATVKALTAESTYVSSLQLLVEPNYQSKKQDGQEGADKQIVDPNIQVDSATQLNLMQGSQLLQKAVDLLRPDYPDLTIKELRKSLSVFQVEGSGDDSKTKIFEATYTANDSVKTQKVLQAVQRVYLNYNREQQRVRLAKGLAFIDEQLPKARLSVTQSEAALEKFRKTQNLIEPDAQTTALTTALNAIQDERRKNQAQYRELQANYNTLQQQVARSPQDALVSSRLSQSTRYQSLLNEIQKTDLALAEQRKRFTDDNPTIQKLLFQRQQQLTLLEKEGQHTVGADSSQLKGESLLREGQLGETDVSLTNKLLELQSSIRGLMAREQTLAEKEQQLRVELERFPSVLADYNRLQPEIKLKRETLDQLEKARQELSLEIARGGFDWQVVEQPLLGEKTGPKKAQIILLGAVAGVMLGGIAAFIRETMDDAVRSSDELKQQVALPVLGITPVLPKAKKSEPRMLLPFAKSQALEPVGNQPIIKLPFGKPKVLAPWTVEVLHWSPSWQSLDLIYKNIQLLNSVSTLRSLMVTSAVAGEGKSTLALGLAISAARLHQRVLLIDADLRNPTLHEKLNLPNDYGLSTLLSSDAPLPIQTSLHSSSAYIDVITSGPISADPANLLSSPRMGELMAEFEQSYDLVLVDAPPVLGLVDSILTASYCGGVLLVARMGQITKTELTQATAMLSKLNLIGVVANGDNSSHNSYAPKSTRGANKENWRTERTAQLVPGVPIQYEGNSKNTEPVNSEK
jgi:capsular exopolysaccharide synthesis family protein